MAWENDEQDAEDGTCPRCGDRAYPRMFLCCSMVELRGVSQCFWKTMAASYRADTRFAKVRARLRACEARCAQRSATECVEYLATSAIEHDGVL